MSIDEVSEALGRLSKSCESIGERLERMETKADHKWDTIADQLTTIGLHNEIQDAERKAVTVRVSSLEKSRRVAVGMIVTAMGGMEAAKMAVKTWFGA